MKPDETPAAEVAPSALPSAMAVTRTLPLPSICFCLTRPKTDGPLYAGMSDFSVLRLDVKQEPFEPNVLSEQKHGSYVTGIVSTGTRLVSGSYDRSLIWWDAASGNVVRRHDAAHEKWIRRLAVTPDARRIFSVADDMQTRAWDAESGECIATWGDYERMTPHGFPSMLYAVCVSPDGRWLATGDKTGRVLVRNSETGEIAATLETPVMYTWDPKARRHSIGGIRSLAFSHDASRLAVGGMGKVGNIDHLEGAARIEILQWQSGERLFEIEDTKCRGLVEALQFTPDDHCLIAAGGDNAGFVSLYNTADGKLLVQEKTGSHLHAFEYQSEQQTIVAVGHQQSLVMTVS